MAESAAYKLVIVESPAKAKTIGKFLGRGYRVEASNGHIRDLPKSTIGVDVEDNFEPKYITIRGRGEILEKIRKEARGASKIFLATDPDREGEAISWHLQKILGIDEGEACRVEFQEITKNAIKNAIKSPRKIDINLVNAQQARRVLDRLVGYKISPLLWAKIKKGLSAGRVQSVATRIIVDRERDIDDFMPEEYWNISAEFASEKMKFTTRYVDEDGKKPQITSREMAEDILKRVHARTYAVSSVRMGERKKLPQPPFTTSNLQQEASRKLNFTAGKTMQIAQQLYEGVDIESRGTLGLITYIRTDSLRVSDEAIAAVRDNIMAKYGASYLPETPNTYKSRKTAQDAHEAIRPADLLLHPESIKASLTKDQLKLYKLIYERFVASQMTPAVYETIAVDIANGECTFRFSGAHMKFPGFTLVYEEGKDDDADDSEAKTWPQLTEGMQLALNDVISEQKFTQPPPRYTEASLVRELEENGIGRPSTYAPTISTIIARGYVMREAKRLVPTELGCLVTDVMTEYFADIVDIAFTADMEEQLDQVEENGQPWKAVIEKFYDPFEKTLEHANSVMEKIVVKDEESDVDCDKCGAKMVYKMGRYGRFLACPRFPECRNTKAILREIDVPCPKCGAKLIERTSKKGRRFYGCEKYPDCDFVSWEQPIKEKCPVCGEYMVLKRNVKKDETWHICQNKECQHKERVETAPDA